VYKVYNFAAIPETVNQLINSEVTKNPVTVGCH